MVGLFRSTTLSRAAAFAVSAATLIAIVASAGAPAPLYPVFETTFGVSAAGITTSFGVYILGVVIALIFFGRISDHVGRRPMALAAVGAAIAGCLLFLTVDDTLTLTLARSMQGISVGLATSAISTYGFELGPEHRPWVAPAVFSAGATTGIAGGAFLSGALVQYVGAPRKTVFVLFTAILLIAAIGILLSPETRTRRSGARNSLIPRVAVPRRLWRSFVVNCVALVAAWSMGALYQSLGPSINAQIFGVENHFLGGLVVATLVGTSAVAGVLAGKLDATPLLLGGCTSLVIGALLTTTAVQTGSVALFYTAALVAGVGFGTTFLGAFKRITSLCTQDERAGLLAAIYIVIYPGSSIPAIVGGTLVSHVGLVSVVTVYGIGVAIVTTLSVGAFFADRRLTQALTTAT
jgi:MFS family permease